MKDRINKSDYLEEILEHFHDGIYITDNEANTIYLNHSYERISGLTVSDMLGKNMKDLVDEGVISMSGTLTVLETGEEITMEQSFSTGRAAIITSIPIFRTGRPENNPNDKSKENEKTVEKNGIIMVVTIVREMTEIYSARKEMRIQEHLKLKYQAELQQLKNEYGGEPDMIAEDGATRKLKRMVDHVKLVDVPILLVGERGTGKRHIAGYIHNYSKRAGKTFLRINFQAIPKDDPSGYLFGRTLTNGEYQIGMLESASGGTVYFEDLAEMPAEIQGRMLSLIRDGECVMGDGTIRKMDLRFLAGSVNSLEQMRRMKKISPDILYAFSMFALEVPALRERKDDIVPLAELFLERCNREKGTTIHISKEGYEKLINYSWPENVLELENTISRAAIICQSGTIEVDDLMTAEERKTQGEDRKKLIPDELPPQMDLREEMAAMEAVYMDRAFKKFGNVRDAASYLGMDASTFTRKRQKYTSQGLM